MTADLIKALELMTYPRHNHDATGEDKDFCAECGSAVAASQTPKGPSS